ncbi:type IV secretory system conjugative DNA transfer family protein [Nocardia salmonicida]|uniref:type IV secretory system conjugative DNA transfer family protein n=1 Tax=Nocardia salmonicida TaxID=53431 RepID=UPI0033E34D80
MDRSIKAPGGGTGEQGGVVALVAVGTAFGLEQGAGASMRIGEALYGGPHQDVTLHPLHITIELMTGQLQWTHAATGGAVTLGVGLVAGLAGTALGSAWAWGRLCEKCSDLKAGRKRPKNKRKNKEAVDARAKYMARGKELLPLGRKAMAEMAAKLGVPLDDGDQPGVLVGRAVIDNGEIFGSYEDLHLDIWGPRQGKSTSRVIPAILEAIGPVVSTSNKRDVVDATRTLREERTGGRSWVFDPQNIAGEQPNWYWDPSEWIWGEDGDGAEVRAAELAGIFAASGEFTGGDPFFEPEGKDLLAGLFLAAAVGQRPITDAYRWVTTIKDETPLQILDDSDFVAFFEGLSAHYAAEPEQRSGVFGTAKKMAHALKFSHVRRWVTPPTPTDAPRRAFYADEFVTSKDTLYLLSGDSEGNAGPLITALAAAVADAGAAEGNSRAGGRMKTPLLIVLDEAANIVRWPSLPKQYSHFGSRGIVVMTILQSWAQGVRCWGEDGMKALWSAANVKVLGSGLDDANFLRDRSELIGDHYELVSSMSVGQGGNKSTSTSRITERTMTGSDLASLPRGRAVVFTSGRSAVLVTSVPWTERDYAPQVHAAIKQAEKEADAKLSDPNRPRKRRRVSGNGTLQPLRVIHDNDTDDYQEGRSA